MKLPLTLEYWQDDGWYVGKLKGSAWGIQSRPGSS